MKLIVGLGNPGEKYKNNRHNVGQKFIDYMAKLLNGYIAKKQFNNITIQQYNNLIFAKPQTFMNNSGQAVKKILTDYRIPITDLLVVHDDLDIPLGEFKIQKGVGPKLHNGLDSIEKALGANNFWRVRIGVDYRQPETWIDGETYVLQNFLKVEENMVKSQIFPTLLTRVKLFLQELK